MSLAVGSLGLFRCGIHVERPHRRARFYTVYGHHGWGPWVFPGGRS